MPTDRELLDEAVRLLRRTVTWSGGTWPAEVIAFVAKVDARPAAPPRADHDWSDERVTNDCQHCARCGVAWLQGVAPPGPCAPPRAEAPAPRVDRNGHPPRVAAHLVANCGLPESSAAPAREEVEADVIVCPACAMMTKALEVRGKRIAELEATLRRLFEASGGE